MRKLLVSIVGALLLLEAFIAQSPVKASTVRQPQNQLAISVYGEHFTLQANQEVTISIPGVNSSDVHVATTIHFRNANPSNRIRSTNTGIHPMYASGCTDSNEGQVWESNGFGTTLISYYLGDYFCYSGGSVTYTSRYIDSWYANSGLAWYYNHDLQFTTPTYHPDVTDSRAIHFTGPF